MMAPPNTVIPGAIFLLLAGCQLPVTTFEDTENAIYYQAAVLSEPATPDTLLVMTWNIKFGGGDIDFWFDCHGERILMTEREVLDNMSLIAAKIAAVNPDIILLQEVDVDSKRSAFVDQAQFLLDSTALNYGVFASIWQVDFIPSDGLGKMNAGNAILSKWPLADAVRIALDLRTDQDAMTQYFYLRRNILRARVDLPGQSNLYALGVHTAAFSQDGTKKEHIDQFKSELDAINGSGGYFVAGGDLNVIPPGSTDLSGFPDAICEDEDFQADDYSQETDWMDAFYASRDAGGYASAVPLADYQAGNAPYFTHTTDPRNGYNRKLDYLFTNTAGGWVAGSAVTHQDIGNTSRALSDHVPVTARWAVP
jgi:endonuclease/exonuclease/phosphatase family metal-dependent hydrolase